MHLFTNEKRELIEKTLGYRFKDSSLLEQALIHRSYFNENKEVLHYNERLEFLGDVVLGLIVSEYLFNRYPDTLEGDLSAMRSKLVDAASCTNYTKMLGLDSHLLLGKGEKLNAGRGRNTILADLFEAIMGAIYLDGGFEFAKKITLSCLEQEFEKTLDQPIGNWKALLQDYCQKHYKAPPDYELILQSGPDHQKMFIIAATLRGEVLGKGEGSSKKVAQQQAAYHALQKLRQK